LRCCYDDTFVARESKIVAAMHDVSSGRITFME